MVVSVFVWLLRTVKTIDVDMKRTTAVVNPTHLRQKAVPQFVRCSTLRKTVVLISLRLTYALILST